MGGGIPHDQYSQLLQTFINTQAQNTPAMQETVMAARPKPYNGKPGLHWLEFEKQWLEYLGLVGHSLNDYAKLQLFRGLLDTSSRM